MEHEDFGQLDAYPITIADPLQPGCVAPAVVLGRPRPGDATSLLLESAPGLPDARQALILARRQVLLLDEP